MKNGQYGSQDRERRVSEWGIVVYRQLSNVSAISWREQVNFQCNDEYVHLYYTNTLVLILIVIAHWNNRARIDVLPHSDTLSLFPTNQSLLFLFNAVYLAEKQQISILLSLVWPDRGSNPRSTALEPSKLIITPLMRFTERRQTKLKTRERGKLTRT